MAEANHGRFQSEGRGFRSGTPRLSGPETQAAHVTMHCYLLSTLMPRICLLSSHSVLTMSSRQVLQQGSRRSDGNPRTGVHGSKARSWEPGARAGFLLPAGTWSQSWHELDAQLILRPALGPPQVGTRCVGRISTRFALQRFSLTTGVALALGHWAGGKGPRYKPRVGGGSGGKYPSFLLVPTMDKPEVCPQPLWRLP